MTLQELPHYQQALESFLENSQGDLTPATSTRVAKAREKLKKLTKIQFSDLSTDVYDEMKRRESESIDPGNSSVPKFLSSQPNYHPKRNQARQKLAALPPSRFKDLVNDVLFEISNRLDVPSDVKTSNSNSNSSFSTTTATVPPIPSAPLVLPNQKNDKNNNFEIDIEKSNQYDSKNDTSYSELKTPTNSEFLTHSKPVTPSQREIKPTTLVPKKAELTWSSDDEDYDDKNNDDNKHVLNTFNNKSIDKDAINRSPSKRDTIATNEVLNEHAMPHVEFPVDNDTQIDNNNDVLNDNLILKSELNELKSKLNEVELENSHLKSKESIIENLTSENELFKSQIDDLNRKAIELEQLKPKYDDIVLESERLKSLTNQYEDYDKIKEELNVLSEHYYKKSEELEALKEIAEIDHEKELSVEDSREFNNLKMYLDKVLEENEELKSKIVAVSYTTNNHSDVGNLKLELEQLKQKHEDLIESHEDLTENYKSLKSHSNELSNMLQNLETKQTTTSIPISINNSSSVVDWQNKYELLLSNKVKEKLLNLSLSNKLKNENLFSSNGLISIENVSNVFASLETVLIYLDSDLDDPYNESFFELKQIEPSVLFDRVAILVSHANKLSKAISIPKDKNYSSHIEEKKRVLSNSISNALSTTKHFALYNNILPRLVLNAAINDVYFSVLNLVSLVKIRSEGSNNVLQKSYLEDNATVTSTPVALKKLNITTESSSNDANITVSNDSFNNNNNNETSVRPLRITQRLASGSTLDVNEFHKPNQPKVSRTGSPIGKILNSPILPVIAASNINDHDNVKIISNKLRNVTRNGSVEKIEFQNKDDPVELNLSIPTVNELTTDTINYSSKKQFHNENNNANGISVSEIASKFSSPDHNDVNNISKMSLPSPDPSKNILDEMKNLDTSLDNDRILTNNSDQLESVDAKAHNAIGKSFNSLEAKNSSADKDYHNEHNEDILKENDDALPKLNGIIKDSGKVLADKNLNMANENNIVNPFIEKVGEYKKNGLFRKELEKGEMLKVDKSVKKDAFLNVADATDATDANDANDATSSSDNEVALNIGFNKENSPKNVKTLNENEAPLRIGLNTEKGKSTNVVMEAKNGAPLQNDLHVSNKIDETRLKLETFNDSDDADDDADYYAHSKNSKGINLHIHSIDDDAKRNENQTQSNKSKNIQVDYQSPGLYKSNNLSDESLPSLKSSKTVDVKDQTGQERVTKQHIFEPERLDKQSSIKSSSFNSNSSTQLDKANTSADDFNNYEGNKETLNLNNMHEGTPSGDGALDIDEGLVRRVSRRENKRLSYKKVPEVKEYANIEEEADVGHNAEGWNYDGESEEDEEEFDIDKFNTLNPDNTLRELLLYLEHQTVEVIGAIQKTLQSIRDPKATKGLLRSGADEINNVVKQMAEGTATLMNQSRYVESMGHAKYVVGVLEDCVHRMEVLYGADISHDNEFAGKNFKQRSAGIAFDVARSTKELVKTVEEASLRDEIAVLDSRLRRE